MNPREMQDLQDLADDLEREADRLTTWNIDNTAGHNWRRLKWNEGHIDGLMFAVDSLRATLKTLAGVKNEKPNSDSSL